MIIYMRKLFSRQVSSRLRHRRALYTGRAFSSTAADDDLTLEKLEERLHELVALRYAESGHDLEQIDMEVLDEVRTRILLSRLPSLSINRARVGQSERCE